MESKPPELDKKDPDSIYNWIIYKLSSPEFGDPLKFYIKDNCETFMNIQENFNINSGKWICTVCGYENDVSKDNII